MKKYILVILLVTIVLTFVLYKKSEAIYIKAVVEPRNILNDINAYRATYLLQPLISNEILCKLADTRAKQITKDWSHNQFQTEIDKVEGMTGTFYENLARGYSADTVVFAWSLSKAGHREAMLVPEMTIGCVGQYDRYYSFEGYTK